MRGERMETGGHAQPAGLQMFGEDLRKVYAPVEDDTAFADLLRALDRAEREQWRAEKRMEALRQLQVEY